MKACYCELFNKTTQTTRYVARVIGLMTSDLQGVKYDTAHYEYLKQDKTNGLKESTGCFNAIMISSSQSTTDVQWWYLHENIY